MTARLTPLILLLATIFSTVGHAAPAKDAAKKPGTLTVLTKPIEPFVFERHGQRVGYSIDLWNRVAEECGFPYEIQNLETVGQVIQGLQDKRADVGIAAISLTEQREQIIDFSHGYFTSGLQILVPNQTDAAFPITAMLKSLMNSNVFALLGVLLAMLILIAHALWFFERRRNPESFPAGYLKGIGESLWWTLCTVIAGGCENKAPIGAAGRLVALFWMMTGVLLLSYVTASVTTSMTVIQLTGEINGPDDLPGQKVATVKDSTAEKYLQDRKAQVQPYPNIEAAIRALRSKKAKAVVYDSPVLLYHVAKSAETSEKVVGPIFRKQDYGIGLQQGSPYRKQINKTLLKLREEGFFEELQMKWFGSKD